MVNKYKLIKEYPGSRKIGYISDCCTSVNSEHYLDGNWFDPALYPEYWEKVVEKDYEVLQYRGIYSKSILGYGDPFVLNPSIPWEHKNLEIYKIKRLSDGEIFTIGDKLDGWGVTTSISLFRIEDNILKVGLREVGVVLLGACKHKKTPLFTTEDGVDIYEGCYVYLVKPTNYICDISNWRKYHGNFGIPLSEDKAFASKDNAEKYIEDNRVQFSRKQLLDFGVYARGFVGELSTEDCFIGWIKSPFGPKK